MFRNVGCEMADVGWQMSGGRWRNVGWQMADVGLWQRCRMADGRCRMADGGWRMCDQERTHSKSDQPLVLLLPAEVPTPEHPHPVADQCHRRHVAHVAPECGSLLVIALGISAPS